MAHTSSPIATARTGHENSSSTMAELQSSLLERHRPLPRTYDKVG